MGIWVKAGGTWEQLGGADRPYARVAGVWEGLDTVHVKVAGSWEQAWQFDVDAPTVRAFTVTGLSNGNVRVAWSGGALATDTGSGMSSVVIEQRYTPYGGSAEAWTTARTLISTEWEATSGSFDFTPPTSKRRQQAGTYPYADTVSRHYMGFRIIATDAAALTTTTGEGRTLTKPYGTIHVIPTSQDSYLSTGAWGGVSADHGVRVGPWSSVGGTSGQEWDWGCYFYGTGIADSCSGYEPNSGSIYVQRYAALGISGTWYLQPHDRSSASGAPSFSGSLYGAAISGTDDFETCAFPAGWLTAAPLGTTMKGIGLVKNGGVNGRTFYSWGQGFVDSGHIELVFS